MSDLPLRIGHLWIFSDGISVPVVSGGDGPDPAPDPSGEPSGLPAEPAGAGGEPPVAPAPAPSPEPTLSDADAALRARLLGEDDPSVIVPDGAVYRDVVPVREQITQLRQQYGGMATAFDGMSDADRQAVLDAAPQMGSDLAFAAQAFGGLDPQDRQVLLQIVALIPDDPVGAGELLAEAATLLRGDPDPGTPPPAAGDPGDDDDDDDLLGAMGFAKDDPNRPITRADFDRMLDERENARELARMEEEAARAMLDEAKALGYHPEADPQSPQGRTARARAGLLFHLARQYGANDPAALAKADADIKAMDQGTIDQYVEGLKANGGRPQPPDGGAPPSDGRVLESLDDAEAAMKDRLTRRGNPAV